MKNNRRIVVCVLFALLACSTVYGQQSTSKSIYSPPSPIPVNGDPRPTNGAYVPPSGGLSDYILYRRDCCEGQPGSYAPLYTEVYLRSGRSIPIGGQTLSRELEDGWSIAAGVRALFFDSELTKAWTIDAHIINTREESGPRQTPFPLTTFVGGVRTDFGVNGIPGVTVETSNRTLVGLGAGREWYIWQPADAPGCDVRVGWDGGGRYGSHNLRLNGVRHITDVIGGVYAAVHSDLEFPSPCGICFTGIRLEWAYTWSDILQRPSDVQELNILVNVGLRF